MMTNELKVRVEETGRSIRIQEQRHTAATGHTKFTKLKWHNIGMRIDKYEMYVTKDCLECNKKTKRQTKTL